MFYLDITNGQDSRSESGCVSGFDMGPLIKINMLDYGDT